MHTNQNETVHNDNTNIDERSSGIRTISVGTTKEMIPSLPGMTHTATQTMHC